MGLMEEMGIPPAVVSRSMEMGRYRVLRFLHVFDKAEEEERDMARNLNERLLEICLEHGFVPYKAPSWAVAKLKERLDPGFKSLMESVKRIADPNGIMNPGRW
jgi:FAD/FMN-containing dehydrogenase